MHLARDETQIPKGVIFWPTLYMYMKHKRLLINYLNVVCQCVSSVLRLRQYDQLYWTEHVAELTDSAR